MSVVYAAISHFIPSPKDEYRSHLRRDASRRALFRARSLVLFILIASLAFSGTADAQDSSTAAVFAKIKPSLGLVLTNEGVGSAFCIASNATSSYYLTNAHVVGQHQNVLVFRQYPSVLQMRGSVVATGSQEDPDLAVIKVPIGHIPSLPLNTGELREGDPIAIAGYPSAQYTLAQLTGSLAPSVHVGTIATIENRGGMIEYDAQTLPGNSGGPLFDPRTGAVEGIVEAKLRGTADANIGIGVARIIVPFLTQNSVGFSPWASSVTDVSAQELHSGQDSSIIRALPGANKVAIVYDSSRATGDNTPNIILNAAQDFAEKVRSTFRVETVLVDATTSTKEDLAQVARDHGALIALTYGCAFRSLSSMTNAYGTYTRWDFGLSSAIVDYYGTVWYASGKKEKTVTSARDNQSAIVSSLADLNDQVLAVLTAKVAAGGDDSVQTNLFRYALPMANGSRKAFFNLSPAATGAKATVFDFGVASEAGLQTGDTVLSVNGILTDGKTQEELTSILVRASALGPYDLIVEGADGKQQHIKFEAKDLRWYVEHREATKT